MSLGVEQRLSIFDAFMLPYTPTTPGDWGVVPTNTGQGLDELASVVLSLIGGVNFQGGYNATTNTPNLTTPLPGAIDKGYMYKVTTAGTAFFSETLEVGDTLFANVDNPSALSDWTVVQANITVPVYSRTYFVSSEVGDDTNDGLSEFSQFATLSNAITVANAATPLPTDGIIIKITDNQVYDPGAGAVTLAGFVSIMGREAQLTGNSGTPTVLSASFSNIEVGAINGTDLEIRQTAGGFGGIVIVSPSIYNVDGLFTMLSANGAVASDTFFIHTQNVTGTNTFVEADTGEFYVTAQNIVINANDGSDVAALKMSNGKAYIVSNDVDGSNSGLGDLIGAQALSGAEVFVTTNCNTADISYNADGAGSKVFATGEVTNAFTETASGIVYSNSMSEGVYFPNLPATAGLALTDIIKIYKGTTAEKATLTQVQALIGGGTIATAQAVNYSAAAGDFVLMTTGATDKTVTLPAAASSTNVVIEVKKVDAGAGNVIIDGNGAETIDGLATQTITTQYTSITLHCDGTEWWIK